jgi:hypothetical protein
MKIYQIVNTYASGEEFKNEIGECGGYVVWEFCIKNGENYTFSPNNELLDDRIENFHKRDAYSVHRKEIELVGEI